MHRGYVKVWRKSLETGMLRSPNMWFFWSWCLLKASHKETDVFVGYQKVHLMPGELVFGRKAAAADLGISEQTIRTLLDSLRKHGNLTIKSTNKYSIISINNWHIYQGEESTINQQTNQPLTSNQPATNQQLTTNKNVKNVKNKKNILPNVEKVKFLDAVYLTNEEHQKLVAKYGSLPTEKAIEILNNGIMAKGYNYKSHYHAVIGWPMREATGGNNGRGQSIAERGPRVQPTEWKGDEPLSEADRLRNIERARELTDKIDKGRVY